MNDFYHRIEIPIIDLEGKNDHECEKIITERLIDAGFNMEKNRISYLSADETKIIIFQDEEIKLFDMKKEITQEKKIIKLSEGILLIKQEYDMMKNKIIHFMKKNGSISIAEVRTLLGLSRKYIIPLLTKMDNENITKRQGNQ